MQDCQTGRNIWPISNYFLSHQMQNGLPHPGQYGEAGGVQRMLMAMVLLARLIIHSGKQVILKPILTGMARLMVATLILFQVTGRLAKVNYSSKPSKGEK